MSAQFSAALTTKLFTQYWHLGFCAIFLSFCQAQFQLASSVEVQLRTEISLIITVRPTPCEENTSFRGNW